VGERAGAVSFCVRKTENQTAHCGNAPPLRFPV
jgi:hypothetical protein